MCESNTDCSGGLACDLESDVPTCRDPGGPDNGGACAAQADCRPGSHCIAENALFGGFPGGLCSQYCTEDAECTNGGICVLTCRDDDLLPDNDCDDDGVAGLDEDVWGLCMELCAPGSPTACRRTGYSCRPVGHNPEGPRHACAVDCLEGGGGCTVPGWSCDPAAGGVGETGFGAGRCQPPFDARQLGEACAMTSGCTGGYCFAEAFTGYPHGACVEECIAGADSPDPCPGDATCMAAAGTAGFCALTCTRDRDCRDELACRWIVIAWMCLPACAAGAECDYGCCPADGAGWCDPTRERCT
jgi:hypothetical protein